MDGKRMPEASSWNAKRAKEIIAEHAGLEAAMLPILHGLQEEFGCVSDAAVPLIAGALNLTRAEVHGVVTFYHDFRRKPCGPHLLQLCRAEACQSMGSEDLAAAVLAKLGFGLTLGQIVDVIGGGTLSGRPVRAVQCGGPLGAYLPRSLFDTPYDYEAFSALDGLVGHGGPRRFRRYRRHGEDGAVR